jgi:ankyrin repeat protein
MSQHFFRLIQSGVTAEIAAAVEVDAKLAQARDAQGVSALMWSVYTGQPMVRDYLLAQLAAQGELLDIFEAAAVGDSLRIEDVLTMDPGAVHGVSGDGWTPLHLAAAFGTPDTVEVLLQHGARVDSISLNPQRNQPLHAALALSRNAETVELLLNEGAQPDAVQAGGFTPLFSAATANRKDLARLLLARGAHAHVRNDAGKTAAEFARERGHEEFAAWLESQPA